MTKCYAIFIYWLCCQYEVFASIDYKWASSTTSGEPCLNTCTSGQCAVDYQLNTKPCIVNRIAGVPVYYTSQYRGLINECLSNCGKFGFDYEWCYTTESFDWDYCSSKVRSPSNIHGYDIYGNPCVDDCLRNEHSSKCHIDSGTYNVCATPARVPVQSILNIFSLGRTRRALDKIFSPELCSAPCKKIVKDGYDGEVQDRIDRILALGNSVQRVTSFKSGAPYTFVATKNALNANGRTVYLPLIVKATLRQLPTPVPRSTSDITTEARNNINLMYNGVTQGIDVGHIIAFQNGGTRDLFNFVGQKSALNRGPYKTIENEINSFINFGGGSAELTVVVKYAGTVPEEFAVKIKLFESDGSLHSDVQDIILKNI